MLSLINRGQIKPQDFVTEASGAVSLKAEARKLLFQALQAKKQEKIVPNYRALVGRRAENLPADPVPRLAARR